MDSIKLNSHVGSDGILHLEVPVNIQNAELEVVVTIKNISSVAEKTRKLNWSPGFLAKTAGAWQGEPLEREPREKYDNREELF